VSVETPTVTPVFRFAPSPNGPLHLGHAYSAVVAHDLARRQGGRFLLRVEDIDAARCTPEFEAAIFEDLDWLGLSFEEPVRRQSDHLDVYRQALEVLADRDLVYPAFLTRGEIRNAVSVFQAEGKAWPRDPDGSPLYPGSEKTLSPADRRALLESGRPYAWRLDMAKALAQVGKPPTWLESGFGPEGETGMITADPGAWGDVILSRSDAPSSYHLAVTVDDALQGVSHVVRGRDLFHATSVHRLLQQLLDLPQPAYHHHRLILGEDGRKLSKSNRDTGISAFRQAGKTPDDLRAMIL
jgi:glutamyl-Q tRNA(Asp) synthetase